jgi:iron complex transport system substrate-binding protein
MPTLVETAGGRNLFGKAGEHSPWLEFSDLEAADPDAIIIAPCGFGIERTITEMPALSGRPGWNSMGAVRGRSVIVADGNQYFNRPGPRIVESAEILAEFLHPEIFNFGHEGIGWRRL